MAENTDDRTLLDAFIQVFGTPTWTPPPSPATYEDEETLRLSFGGLSKSARSAGRRWSERPSEPWMDSIATCAERAWGGDVA